MSQLANPVDRLILDESAGMVAGRITVLDDPTGELAIAVAQRSPGATVVVHCDSVLDEQAVRSRLVGGGLPIDVGTGRAAALTGAELVLWRLPRSVDAVAEVAELAAAAADPQVALVGGARVKHLARGMNAALARGFSSVRASLGRDKSRVLHAAGKRVGVQPSWPKHRLVPELGFSVYAHGGVFAGTRVDRGTRLLLSALDSWTPGDGPVLDCGCGTGILAAWVAGRFPDVEVVASDVSAAAVASTRLTAPESVRCEHADGLSNWGPESLGAIVTNPPFHVGAAKDSTPTLRIIDDAGRVLRPGGELIMVYNAHLPYLPRLRKVGATEIIARDRSYLVTRTVR